MRRIFFSIMLLTLATGPARAHFIWIVPDGTDENRAKMVFSENLEPDDTVQVEKIGGAKLIARDANGKLSDLAMTKGEDAFRIKLPAKGAVAAASHTYGLFQRGKGKPFLLKYYAKYFSGEVQGDRRIDKLAFEFVAKSPDEFLLIFDGKPVAGAEVIVLQPGDKSSTVKTDNEGRVKVPVAAEGWYGLRSRNIESKAGDHGGKKYDEIRHYTTVVFKAAQKSRDLPPLPRAVASFGAAVADGWLYVYGGHCARTHQYSTEAVVGTLHRLHLASPKSWESLPGGSPVQGLALVSHRGKLYRIGGMQPRNQPGEKADNHSTASSACFDPATRKWTALPDLPSPRSSHDAVVVGDRIYVLGGWNLLGAGKKAEWQSTVAVLDLSQQPLRWQTLPQPFQRRALTTVVHDGKIYVVGGMDADNEVQRTVNVLNPATGEWAKTAEIPAPKRNGFAPAACSSSGRLYVNGSDGRLLRLSTDATAWEDRGSVRERRIVHRMVEINGGKLAVLGGALNGENISSVEVIVP